MGQDLVLKSKKYLDKNNIAEGKANYKNSEAIFGVQLSVISLISPAIVVLMIGDPIMFIVSLLSFPLVMGIGMGGFKIRHRAFVLKTKILKICRKLNVELSSKDFETLKENTKKIRWF